MHASAWVDEVWLAYDVRATKGTGTNRMENVVAIYDHQFLNGTHIWSIGPWSQQQGGAQLMDRFAYAFTTLADAANMQRLSGLQRTIESKDLLTIARVWCRPTPTATRPAVAATVTSWQQSTPHRHNSPPQFHMSHSLP